MVVAVAPFGCSRFPLSPFGWCFSPPFPSFEMVHLSLPAFGWCCFRPSFSGKVLFFPSPPLWAGAVLVPRRLMYCFVSCFFRFLFMFVFFSCHLSFSFSCSVSFFSFSVFSFFFSCFFHHVLNFHFLCHFLFQNFIIVVTFMFFFLFIFFVLLKKKKGAEARATHVPPKVALSGAPTFGGGAASSDTRLKEVSASSSVARPFK